MTSSKAYQDHPAHVLEFDAAPVHARVSIGSEIIAETSSGLNLREGRYPAVIYFPREDVRMDRLRASDHQTHCPFKGDASYFDHPSVEQIAWSYDDPFDQMLEIRGHLAFYADRAEIEIVSG